MDRDLTSNPGDPRVVLASLPDRRLRADSLVLCDLFEEITGYPPQMWGPSIIGFTSEVPDDDISQMRLELGFSPRQNRLVLLLSRHMDHYVDFTARLGDVTVGQTCITIESLALIEMAVLRELIEYAWSKGPERADLG